MAKLDKNIGIPLNITVTGKLNFIGKLGLFVMKIGANILKISAVRIEVK